MCIHVRQGKRNYRLCLPSLSQESVGASFQIPAFCSSQRQHRELLLLHHTPATPFTSVRVSPSRYTLTRKHIVSPFPTCHGWLNPSLYATLYCPKGNSKGKLEKKNTGRRCEGETDERQNSDPRPLFAD